MPPAQLLLLAAGRQSLQPVFTYRLQHAKARFAFGSLLPHDQTLVHQRDEFSHDVGLRAMRLTRRGADRFRRRQRTAIRENRQPLKETPFWFIEQVIAP